MNYQNLPKGYRKISDIDLQEDLKKALFINLLSVLIAVVMVIPVLILVPLDIVFNITGLLLFCFKIMIAMASIILYLFLHEAVHGVFMKSFGKVKPKYGFTGLYAYTGSTAFFDKKSYIIISLAPVVIWGIIIGIINILIPASWFWIAYVVQVFNISGAIGDIYVVCKIMILPRDILIYDTGVRMEIYSFT